MRFIKKKDILDGLASCITIQDSLSEIKNVKVRFNVEDALVNIVRIVSGTAGLIFMAEYLDEKIRQMEVQDEVN